MSGEQDPRGPTPPAIVVLGASNVSRGLARLAAVVTSRHKGPVDLFLAAGHGRSYGANSRVFMRRLPSIVGCGLWRALDREGVGTERPVHALITDIGNDLLYGFPDHQLAAWVRESLARLTRLGANVAITRLPMASIDRVGPLRYRALRTLYVPGCRLSLAEMKEAAMRMDHAVAVMAREFGAIVIDQPGEWYGLDAIHVRRRYLDTLWHRACDAWGVATEVRRRRASFIRWAALGSRAAEVRSLATVMRFTPQPAYRDRESLRLWLY
ncbi:MAG: hypothetical protein ACKOEX_09910 [Planctomycetia bacterium]